MGDGSFVVESEKLSKTLKEVISKERESIKNLVALGADVSEFEESITEAMETEENEQSIAQNLSKHSNENERSVESQVSTDSGISDSSDNVAKSNSSLGL